MLVLKLKAGVAVFVGWRAKRVRHGNPSCCSIPFDFNFDFSNFSNFLIHEIMQGAQCIHGENGPLKMTELSTRQ